jgi:hypothetical protein
MRCDECSKEHNRKLDRERARRKRSSEKYSCPAEAASLALIADNRRFVASAGTYGKGRIKEMLAKKKEEKQCFRTNAEETSTG